MLIMAEKRNADTFEPETLEEAQAEIARLREELLKTQQELEVFKKSKVERKLPEVKPFNPESRLPPWAGPGLGRAGLLDLTMDKWAVLNMDEKKTYWSKWAQCKRAKIEFDKAEYTTDVDAKYFKMLNNKIEQLLNRVRKFPRDDVKFDTSGKNFRRFVERAVSHDQFEYLITRKPENILSALNTYIVTDESGDQERACIDFQNFIEDTGYDSGDD